MDEKNFLFESMHPVTKRFVINLSKFMHFRHQLGACQVKIIQITESRKLKNRQSDFSLQSKVTNANCKSELKFGQPCIQTDG